SRRRTRPVAVYVAGPPPPDGSALLDSPPNTPQQRSTARLAPHPVSPKIVPQNAMHFMQPRNAILVATMFRCPQVRQHDPVGTLAMQICLPKQRSLNHCVHNPFNVVIA